MNTRETLILKTLECKKLHRDGGDTARFIDAALEQNPEQADAVTKNVCARIPWFWPKKWNNWAPFRPEQAGNHHVGDS